MGQAAVVIGAGITGTLVAHTLVRQGWRVVLLEAEHVGAGSSSRTAAGIRQQFSTPETVLGMRYSVDFYRDFPARVGGAEVPIVQNGYLFLLDTQESVDEARVRLRVQHRCGLREAELLEGDALSRRFPWVEPCAVLAATWCPTDGFLHPATVYNEAAQAAVREGAELLQRAAVTGVERSGDRITAVLSTRGRHPADLVIDATNAWSPRLARILGATELPIVPLKRCLWFAERAGSLSAEALAAMPLTIAPSGAYMRPENGDSLLMGWSRPVPPEPDFSYADQDAIPPAFFHKSGTDSVAYETWASLAEVIPAVGEFAGITATTGGYYGTTPDHNPFLGYDPLVPNLIRLAGFSGHGAMFGPFTALVASELARAGHDVPTVSALGHDVPVGAFRIGRDPVLPESLVI